jgi:PRC-barrel domain
MLTPSTPPQKRDNQMNKSLGATALAVLLSATAAVAQTTSPASPPAEKMSPPAASTTTVTKDGLVLTEAQANAWIKKAVYSSDGKNVGEVTALKRDASGKIAELQAGIGGFIGIGETQVRLMPAQFKLENDRVVLSLTAEQVKALPKILK